MNVDILTHEKSISKARARMAIADCDIHPSPKSVEIEIFPFLSKRWQEYMKTYGVIYRQGFPTGPAFPKGQPNAARRDSYPASGGKPGSDLAFMQSQHLGPNNIQLGVLNPLQCAQGVQNQDFSAAYCNAVNQWQIEQWTSKDHRLKASLMVPYEDPLASVKEIEKWAGNKAPQRYRAKISEMPFFVAEIDNQILGFTRYNLRTKEFCSLYINPNFVRQGIGTTLAHYVFDDARRRGLTEMWLNSALNAVSFYETIGFRQIEKTTHDFGKFSLKCVRMEINLGNIDNQE